MRREKIRRPRPAPLKRGPLVLLGDGVLLFLVLAGAVGSFCTAFTLDVSLPLVYAGCALCALIFLAVVCSETKFSFLRKKRVDKV